MSSNKLYIWYKKQDAINLLIYGFILIIIVQFGFKVYDKFSFPEKSYNNKIITTTKIGKVCLDNNNITECYEIDNRVYKVYLYMENSSETLPILHLKAK